jgi:hypothetical protein
MSVIESTTGLAFEVMHIDENKIVIYNETTKNIYSGGLTQWRSLPNWDKLYAELVSFKLVSLKFVLENIRLELSVLGKTMNLSADYQTGIKSLMYNYDDQRHVFLMPTGSVGTDAELVEIADEFKTMLSVVQTDRIEQYQREKALCAMIVDMSNELNTQKQYIVALTTALNSLRGYVEAIVENQNNTEN